MILHGDDHFLHRQAELVGRRLDDAQVGLVRNEPVDVAALDSILRQRFVDQLRQRPDGNLEHFVPLHLQAVGRVVAKLIESLRHAVREVEQVLVLAVRMQVSADDARLIRRREDDRASAVAEKYSGPAVGPVDESGQALDADHKGALRLAEPDVLVGDRERVDESAAGRLERERGTAVDVEALLQERACVREDEVGRRRADDDEIDVGRRHAGRFQCAPRCMLGERRTRLVGCRDVAALDAGARTGSTHPSCRSRPRGPCSTRSFSGR